MVAPADVIVAFMKFLQDNDCSDKFYERLNRNKSNHESIPDFVHRALKNASIPTLIRSAFAWDSDFGYWLNMSRLWEDVSIALLVNSTSIDEAIKNGMLDTSYQEDNFGPLTNREALDQAYTLSSHSPDFEHVKTSTSFRVTYDKLRDLYKVYFFMSNFYYNTVVFKPLVVDNNPTKSYKSIW